MRAEREISLEDSFIALRLLFWTSGDFMCVSDMIYLKISLASDVSP